MEKLKEQFDRISKKIELKKKELNDLEKKQKETEEKMLNTAMQYGHLKIIDVVNLISKQSTQQNKTDNIAPINQNINGKD